MIIAGAGRQETWAEEEQNEGAACTCTFPGTAGRRLTVTNISGQLINMAAVAAFLVIPVELKRGANTIFRGVLLQSKTEAAGGVDRFTVPVQIPLALGESAVLKTGVPAAGVRLILNMSGTVE